MNILITIKINTGLKVCLLAVVCYSINSKSFVLYYFIKSCGVCFGLFGIFVVLVF